MSVSENKQPILDFLSYEFFEFSDENMGNSMFVDSDNKTNEISSESKSITHFDGVKNPLPDSDKSDSDSLSEKPKLKRRRKMTKYEREVSKREKDRQRAKKNRDRKKEQNHLLQEENELLKAENKRLKDYIQHLEER
jgi:hypothetical protein